MKLKNVTSLLISLVALQLSLSAAVVDVSSVYVRDDGTPDSSVVVEDEGFLWFSAPKQALRFGQIPDANYGMVYGSGVGEASLAFGHRAMAGGYASFAAGGSHAGDVKQDTVYAFGDYSFGYGVNVHNNADHGFAFGVSVNVRPTAVGAEGFANCSYVDAVGASAFGTHH